MNAHDLSGVGQCEAARDWTTPHARLARPAAARRTRVDSARAVGVLIAVATLALPVPAVCGEPLQIVLGGDANRGSRLITSFGCGACHTVPGVNGANGDVGPPLQRFGQRSYIAGMLRNSPSNLVRWIRDPQGVVPGNAMPNMGVTENEARDIAAYLYTLR